MNGSKYFLGVLLSLAGLFFLQTLALDAVNGFPGKSESNYFSSLGRIQAGIRRDPAVMLLGSSLTGRLPDEKDGFQGVANMGCDGGSAIDVIRAIDDGTISAARVLVIEANTLRRGLQSSEGQVGEAMTGYSFLLGNKIPQLSSAARPSGFFYSWLMQFRGGADDVGASNRLPVVSSPAIVKDVSELSEEEEKLVAELGELIGHLKDKGSLVYLVMLPPGGERYLPNERVAESLSFLTQTPYWDLTDGLPDGSVRLTDEIHMDQESATRTLRAIFEQIEIPTQ